MNRILALQKLVSNASSVRSKEILGFEETFLNSSISGICGTVLGQAAQN